MLKEWSADPSPMDTEFSNPADALALVMHVLARLRDIHWPAETLELLFR
jgi:hypothetical protein